MKKLIGLLITTIIVSLSTIPAHAEDIAGQSASVAAVTAVKDTSISDSRELVKKKLAIKRVLERRGSPLANTVDGFMAACMKYDIDCYMLPAISGVESSFGLHYMPGTYNPFGWGRGLIAFESWEDGYMTVAKGLRENYIDRGATDIYSIGRIYCEGDTWAGKVVYFMDQFEAEEEKLSLYF